MATKAPTRFSPSGSFQNLSLQEPFHAFIDSFCENLSSQSTSLGEKSPWQVEAIQSFRNSLSVPTPLSHLYRSLSIYYEHLMHNPAACQAQCNQLLHAFLDSNNLKDIASCMNEDWITLLYGLAFGPFWSGDLAHVRASPKVTSLDLALIIKLMNTFGKEQKFPHCRAAKLLGTAIPRIHFSALTHFAPTLYEEAKNCSLLWKPDIEAIDQTLCKNLYRIFLVSLSFNIEWNNSLARYGKFSYCSSAWLLLSKEDQGKLLWSAVQQKRNEFLDFIAEEYPDTLGGLPLKKLFPKICAMLSCKARSSLLTKASELKKWEHVRYILENHPDTLTVADPKQLYKHLIDNNQDDLAHVVSLTQQSLYLLPIQKILSEKPLTQQALYDLFETLFLCHKRLLEDPLAHQQQCEELLNILLTSRSFFQTFASAAALSSRRDFFIPAFGVKQDWTTLLLGLAFDPFARFSPMRHKVKSLNMDLITRLLNHPLLRGLTSKDYEADICSIALANLIPRLYFSRFSGHALDIYNVAKSLHLLKKEDDELITRIVSLSLSDLFLQSILANAEQDGGTIENPLISYYSSAWLLLSVEEQQMLLAQANKFHCKKFLTFIEQEYPETLVALKLQALTLQ